MLYRLTNILCFVDSASTHAFLKSNNIFFSCLVMRKVNINIGYGTTIYVKAL